MPKLLLNIRPGWLLALTAVLVAFAILFRLGLSDKRQEFPGTLTNWVATVLSQDKALKVLSVGQTPRFFTGVFDNGERGLFIGFTGRYFLNTGYGGTFELLGTNARPVNYTFIGYLIYTNTTSGISLRGWKTVTEGYVLGQYVKPESNAVVVGAKFIADIDDRVIDSNTLQWAGRN